MLVEGLNDGDASIEATAVFLERLRPHVAYVAVPTRPPAEPWVCPAGGEAVNRAFQRFAERLPRVELLTEFEGTAFGTFGDPVEDLLAITTVHPMREDAALALFERAGADRARLERLVDDGRLEEVLYRGHAFYVRPSRGEATGRRPAPNP